MLFIFVLVVMLSNIAGAFDYGADAARRWNNKKRARQSMKVDIPAIVNTATKLYNAYKSRSKTNTDTRRYRRNGYSNRSGEQGYRKVYRNRKITRRRYRRYKYNFIRGRNKHIVPVEQNVYTCVRFNVSQSLPYCYWSHFYNPSREISLRGNIFEDVNDGGTDKNLDVNFRGQSIYVRSLRGSVYLKNPYSISINYMFVWSKVPGEFESGGGGEVTSFSNFVNDFRPQLGNMENKDSWKNLGFKVLKKQTGRLDPDNSTYINFKSYPGFVKLTRFGSSTANLSLDFKRYGWFIFCWSEQIHSADSFETAPEVFYEAIQPKVYVRSWYKCYLDQGLALDTKELGLIAGIDAKTASSKIFVKSEDKMVQANN